MLLLIPLSLLVERLVNLVKIAVTVNDADRWVYAGVGWFLGVAIALALGLDLFVSFGHPIQIPLLAQALTGLVLGGGSNLTSDLVGTLRAKQPAV